MVKNIDKKLICSIKKHINNELLKLKFYHPKINILKKSVSYKNIYKINWNTVYKFNCKFIKCTNKYTVYKLQYSLYISL